VDACVEVLRDENSSNGAIQPPESILDSLTIPAHAILWRRLDQEGHESARLSYRDALWHLSGTAVFTYEQQPCGLDYRVICNQEWHTLSGRVSGWVGGRPIQIELSADSSRHWQLNGESCPQVDGCIDLDLNFSPSTNLLPIRRLDLGIGTEAKVRAAWLRFPEFTLEPLDQLYRRTELASYRYESGGGTFVTELRVTEAGFVAHYGNFFEIIA